MSKPIKLGASEIILAERLRISQIVESPEGVARPKSARELALRSNMPAVQAIEFLRTTPAENQFAAAMEAFGPTGVPAPASPQANGTLGDPRSARLAEISGSMKHYNASKGYSNRRD